MTTKAKLKLIGMQPALAAVCFAAGYAQGTHDMWMAVKDAIAR